MNGWRRVLAFLGLRPEHDPDLRKTRTRHVRAIAKADRVYEDFRKMDGAIRIVVQKR